MIFTLFILFIISLWVVNAWHDADFKNKKDHHLSGAFLACLAVAGVFILKLTGVTISDYNDYINISFLLLSFRWIIFDISYNLFTGQKWWYKGSTAAMDKYISNWLQMCFKAIALFFDILIIRSYC